MQECKGARVQLLQGWVGVQTNTGFAWSKSMDLNDFLIRSDALDIFTNLVTQSHWDYFSWTNKKMTITF